MLSKAKDNLKLNIGGLKTLQVSRETLTSVPDSRLANLVSGITDPLSSDVFIDRDPASFELLVSYLRNDQKISKIEDPFLKG